MGGTQQSTIPVKKTTVLGGNSSSRITDGASDGLCPLPSAPSASATCYADNLACRDLIDYHNAHTISQGQSPSHPLPLQRELTSCCIPSQCLSLVSSWPTQWWVPSQRPRAMSCVPEVSTDPQKHPDQRHFRSTAPFPVLSSNFNAADSRP